MFFLWLVLTFIAAIYFISSRLTLFDPQMKLTGKDSHFVIKQLKQSVELMDVDLRNTIIHFTSNNCACSQYSEEHKESINNQAKLAGFNVININLAADFLTIIPSTPAILILNEIENLLYFGPYSTGLACSESNGYVETVLKNYAKGFNSDLMITDVKGCYCNI